MTAVLVAEDDATIAEPLARALDGAGYDVELHNDGGSVLDRVRAGEVALVLLDVDLPDIDGIEVCKRLRRATPRLPVLMLSDRPHESDAVAGLDAGADDYVVKPFREAELLARVRALLRRSRLDAAARAAAGGGDVNGIRIDVASRRAWQNGTELTLTTKEFDLLYVLVREAGTVVTREQLMREVWGVNWWGSTKTLDMHVSWLRRKLGDNAAKPRLITTVRGVGFRFERE